MGNLSVDFCVLCLVQATTKEIKVYYVLQKNSSFSADLSIILGWKTAKLPQ